MLSFLTSGLNGLINLIMSVCVTLIALTLHELAHGWVSMKLGDPTPRIQGRMTLNPLAHLDLIGTLLMVFTGFGWAKPVEVNPMYYKDRKKGMALVGIAGPVTNLLLAVLGVIIWIIPYVIMNALGSFASNWFIGIFDSFMYLFIIRNLWFMVFNLIPIPPLDGSRVIGLFLSNSAYYKLMQYERYSLLIIMLLSITGVFDTIITRGVYFFFNLIFNSVSGILGILV